MADLAPAFLDWLAALEERHLANLTRAELTRSLRALSSCYVERRSRLSSGAALDGAGKRAAFALFYAPLHFLAIDRIVRALGADALKIDALIDLGCGTGAAGAAWAVACARPPRVSGIDRNPWAMQEANWTYRHFAIRGRAATGDVMTASARGQRGAVLLAYTANELPDDKRARLLDRVVERSRAGEPVLVVEPIARSATRWWSEWTDRMTSEGARIDEWRFPAALPPLLSEIARGAGLDSKELTARTIFSRRN